MQYAQWWMWSSARLGFRWSGKYPSLDLFCWNFYNDSFFPWLRKKVMNSSSCSLFTYHGRKYNNQDLSRCLGFCWELEVFNTLGVWKFSLETALCFSLLVLMSWMIITQLPNIYKDLSFWALLGKTLSYGLFRCG